MRIAVVIHSLGCGGAERVAALLANSWADRGNTVALITFDSARSRFHDAGPEVLLIPLDAARDSRHLHEAIINNLRRIGRLRRALRRFRPDCVVALGHRTNITCLAAGAGAPVVISERVDPSTHGLDWKWAALRRILYPRAGMLVMQTRSVVPWARRVMRGGAVIVIPNAVLVAESNSAPVIDLPPGETIVAAGRLTHQKGFDILLRAFARICDAIPTWSLVILGEGELRDELESLVAELGLTGRVRLPGVVRDPDAVFASAKMFVLPSRFEGFPNALLEAMASGMPVIAADCRSGPSEIVEHGSNGILVPTESVAELAAAMLNLARDEAGRHKLGRAARQVTERFSLDRCMDRWDDAVALARQSKAAWWNWRKPVIHAYSRVRGHDYLDHYRECLRLDDIGDAWAPMRANLARLLDHCRRQVPYYARLLDTSPVSDPFRELQRLPILTKSDIRSNFEALQSADIGQRKCFFNTSGGSTGEPIRLIQDDEYRQRSRAVTMMFSKWTGKEMGEPELRVWGSERDVFLGTEGALAKIRNFGQDVQILNAFRMSPERMREYLRVIHRCRSQLIVAYAQAMYELANFALREGIQVRPQRAILTSAGTLYGFMRERIEAVFGAKVFNRYGSREVGDMASECEAHQNLHIAPMGCVIEVVDDEGQPVPAGTEGNILVTSLTNFAMPLLRYQIGDRGILSPDTVCGCGRRGPMLRTVLGRNVDAFRTPDGTLIDGEYFTHLLYFRDWVKQFQVIQRDFDRIEYLVVPQRRDVDKTEIEDIEAKTRLVLGAHCRVALRFVDDIPPSASGKFRYTISEVQPAVLSNP